MGDGQILTVISAPPDASKLNCNSLRSSESTSSDEVLVNELTKALRRTRTRTISSSKGEDDIVTTESGQKVYTKGRPPWYDLAGKQLKKSYLIGICGGSASGKTTVAKKIIERLEMPWVTVLAMDSFYKVLNEEQHQLAAKQEYNFDHPDAFDFELLRESLVRLREGKSVEVPVYDFSTHRRAKNPKLMYGADIIIFEGILAFHKSEISELMDLKVFVDTDSDIRLARRLERDIAERGRDATGVLEQYLKFVKPAFDMFIAPEMKIADIIVPRGGENTVAIDLIVRQIKNQLAERGYYSNGKQHSFAAFHQSLPIEFPSSLHILRETSLEKNLFRLIRTQKITRNDFLLSSTKHIQSLMEESMRFVFSDGLEGNEKANGRHKICGVSIMRTGEYLERSLRSVVKDCKIGKLLIKTNKFTSEPELYYLRLPKNICKYKIFLMDAIVSSGAAAMMAIRILLDHDVLEEDIVLLSLLMAERGVHSLAYAFPRVQLLTISVDKQINEHFRTVLGVDDFDENCVGPDCEVVQLVVSDDDADEDGEDDSSSS
ncbi:hypothetical protein niasHT_034599 [Heterodera trifolii]|uniref:Uridine kinase n=1 Tax=Heterodera trifolii TaxID=157864 RepID=A0ABD2ILK1_9BILA